ncbi:MAG: zinc-dependent metalloprotease family protein [Saprospiraceae bacterium]
MKKLLTTALAALFTLLGYAQEGQNPWLDLPESDFAQQDMQRRIIPLKYRTLSLDFPSMKKILSKAPVRFSPAAEGDKPLLSIPMPDGGFDLFELVDAPVMHPDLAARYPYIRSFAGTSKDDPTAYLRCGITQKGFHAVVFSGRHSTVYIDAYALGDTDHYICYFKKDFKKEEPFGCFFDEIPENKAFQAGAPPPVPDFSGDCKFRTYMLALACTGEYAQYHGGTVPLVMAEYNVAMTRVNGVFEKDISVTMQLVPNTDDLIFLNAATDPYTNGDGGAMLDENQITCDNIIGNSNYDIGHVFSTGGGGVAALFAVCNVGSKAMGVTGGAAPEGDPFYIDYVAHEMGHQYGANHTQNNPCNRHGPTAMEPGSASTIMGYAGICDPNVQSNSDDYFHAISIDEMNNFITVFANSCATTVTGGNTAPMVSLPVSSYHVPVSTPFVLTASGTDSGGDILTYCWEQMDNEVANMPPEPTNTGGPAFRSLPPVEDSSRYFPNLPSIVANANNVWEVLPSVGRSMNFRCTARDNHIGGGCTGEADLTLNFSANAGPFVVTAPNTATALWTAVSNEVVTWNVANTNNAPVNTGFVKIMLSVDGGGTYPYTLLASTPNDGSQVVQVPNVATGQARVMVKALNNVFFDISDKDFTIQLPPFPTFTMTITPPSIIACTDDQATFQMDFQAFAGFNETVSLSVTGQPPGSVPFIFPQNLVPPGMALLTFSNLSNSPPGTYPLIVTAQSLSVTQTATVDLILPETISVPPMLLFPANGATGIAPGGTLLTWQMVPGADTYLVQVATDPAFQNLVASATLADTTFLAGNTLEATVYYWRVRAFNVCHSGTYSPTFAFQTSALSCGQYASTNVPIVISDTTTSLVIDSLAIPEDFPLASLRVSLNISHTWVSDLSAAIVTPQDIVLQLFDQPGIPGPDCGSDDLDVKFSDSALNTAADFENTCNPDPPAIEGEFQPIDPFAIANGQSSAGTWKLIVGDNFPEDGGTINSWSVDFCGIAGLQPAILLVNQPLVVPEGQSGTITNGLLQVQGTADSIVFTLLSTPQQGTLYLQGVALVLGDQFTQADIDNGLLSYQHTGNMVPDDGFLFDVTDANQQWLHNQFFQIQILINNLAATLELTEDIDCNGAENAVLTVVASGNNPPLTYSLNGGPFQSSPIFGNLGPGTYTATVMDATGFAVTTNSVTVANPVAITVSATVINDDITVTASGGAGMLTYSIDGVNFQASNQFLNLPNGTYTITVKDANGCLATTTATVAVNNLMVIAIGVPISCFGDNDGEITVVVTSGGTPPFQYSLNGGPFQSNPVFSNLAPGSYLATVLDADGFTQTAGPVILTEPALLTATAIVVDDDVTVIASGGSGSISYSLDGIIFQASNEFPNLPNGTYTITVMDQNGCTATTSATINVNTLNVLAAIVQAIGCFGESNGEISATTSGGNPPYQFSLNSGPLQSSPTFGNLGPGTYSITVMDADGLTKTSNTVTLAEPAQIIATATIVGDDVTVTASGGTAPLMYSIDGINFQSSNQFLNLPNGTYTITVKDGNGCTATTTAVVLVNNLSISVAIVQGIDCFGEMTGEVMAIVIGGTPPYQYSLNGGAFQSSGTFTGLGIGSYTVTVMDANGFTQTSNSVMIAQPSQLVLSTTVIGNDVTVNASGGTPTYLYSLGGSPFQSSNQFPDLPNGTYTVVVADGNGCTATTSTTVLINNLSITVAISQGISCFGGNNGEITATAAGGMPPLEYSLNGGPFQSSPVFSNLGPGSYTVMVRDADGFTLTSNSVTLLQPAQLNASATVVDDDVTVTANGGTGTLLYSLDGITYQANNQFFNLPNGTYTITVTDANGCVATTTATVFTNNLNLLASITQTISCFGENDGEISVTASGGSPPYQFKLNNGPFQSSPVFQNIAAGSYTVMLMDVNGFTQMTNVTVSDPPQITISTLTNGYTVTATASGGSGALTYSLDGGAFQTSGTFFPVSNGSHTVTVKDGNGCEASASLTVSVPALTLGLSITQALPCSYSAIGQITAVASGGVSPYEYNVNGGPFQTGNLFNGLSAGSYTVTVKDSGGFTFSQNIVLDAPPVISATANVAGSNVLIMASGGTGVLHYSLDGSPFQTSNTFTNVPNGPHTVTILDANGCEAILPVLVNGSNMQVTATLTKAISCHNGTDAIITVMAMGGTQPYQYSLNGVNFQSSNVFANLPAGSYNIVVKDATGATSTTPTITVANPPALLISASAFGMDITAAGSGGTGSLQYALDGGPYQAGSLFSVPSNGSYTVHVKDANGCMAETVVVVNAPDSLLVVVTPPSCFDSMDAQLTIVGVNGGYQPYLYSINGGPFTSSLIYPNLGSGSYAFVVEDSTGYQFEAPPTLVENPPVIVLNAEVDGNALTVHASGGTGPLLFSIDGGGTFQADSVFNDLPNGTYNVVVMDENGCTVSTMAIINFNLAGDTPGGLSFEVLPNPSEGLFLIKMDLQPVGPIRFAVYDVAGRLVFQREWRATGSLAEKLDLRHLANGSYQLRITDEERWGVKRLVIVR